ncbi:MAG: response regulator [Ignavibacteriales bacterium]|nr:response regulator [Ignavibacteriales bacterium]
MKILVVDDELDIQSLFKQKFKNELKDEKIEFCFAFSAEDAIKFLNSTSSAEVVLILSDINMPGMTGLELLKVIKEKFPHLKVFMITAYDDEEKHSKAIRYGADKYLTKPIDFDELKNAIISINT